MAAMRVAELMTGKSSPPSTIMQARIAVPECGKRLEDTLRAANKTLLASLPDLAVLLRLARRAALGFVSCLNVKTASLGGRGRHKGLSCEKFISCDEASQASVSYTLMN